jgi:hypothetical protein
MGHSARKESMETTPKIKKPVEKSTGFLSFVLRL